MSTHANAAAGHAGPASDDLAAALSRQDFVAELRAAQARAARDGQGIVLCLVDVDQLRNVNALHGVAAGDAALASIMRRAWGVLGHAPALFAWQLARFDGDSLMILVRGAALRDGERIAEELRRAVSGERRPGAPRITVSIAVTAYRSGESIDALLARTEQTLHLAKQFGCDRVETAWTREPRGASAHVAALGAARRGRPRRAP